MIDNFDVNELYNKYDEIVTCTAINVFGALTRHGIILAGFDKNSKEHLYYLYVVMTIARQYNKEIYIDASFWTRLSLYKHTKRYFKGLIKGKRDAEGMVWNVSDHLEHERGAAVELIGDEGFRFGDIYDAFYNPSNIKKG